MTFGEIFSVYDAVFSVPFTQTMHRTHVVVTDLGQRSVFSFWKKKLSACRRLQDCYFWPKVTRGVTVFDQQTCERQDQETGGPALSWSTEYWFSQTDTKFKIYWTKEYSSLNTSIKISLCAKFHTLWALCFPEIMKFIGAKLRCSAFRGLSSSSSA